MPTQHVRELAWHIVNLPGCTPMAVFKDTRVDALQKLSAKLVELGFHEAAEYYHTLLDLASGAVLHKANRDKRL